MQEREVQELGQKLRNALRCTLRDEREREREESLILTRRDQSRGEEIGRELSKTRVGEH